MFSMKKLAKILLFSLSLLMTSTRHLISVALSSTAPHSTRTAIRLWSAPATCK